jgi:hypothetical protein
MSLKLDVKYKAVSRDERGTSNKRGEEASNLIKFHITYPHGSNSDNEIGVFTSAEMRLMLGSEHPHYVYIKTYLVNPDYQSDDEDDAGWNPAHYSKAFTGEDGLALDRFTVWAKKFRGGKIITDFL